MKRVFSGAALVVAYALSAGFSTAIPAQEPGPRPQMEGLPSMHGPLEDPEMEALATRIASDLRCPVCQGLSIQASPSPLAQQMKDLIRSQLVEGRSEEEVKAYFVSKYGEWVLMEPKAEGFNLLVYLLPAAGLLAGIGLIAVAVRRWTVPPKEAPSEGG
jgi:cytochrome c-type biogenesis protein CcmH/NrfF